MISVAFTFFFFYRIINAAALLSNSLRNFGGLFWFLFFSSLGLKPVEYFIETE